MKAYRTQMKRMENMSKYAVVEGNVIEGFALIGPFDSSVEASNWANSFSWPKNFHIWKIENPDEQIHNRKAK